MRERERDTERGDRYLTARECLKRETLRERDSEKRIKSI